MSAAEIWILFPVIFAAGLFFLRRWTTLATILGTLAAGTLAWLAWRLPIEEALLLGPISIKLESTLVVLGRSFELVNTDRPILALVYLLATVWFAAAHLTRPSPLFVPIGLWVVALLTAAMAVNPFLYAALFLQITTLLSVPILTTPGQPVGRGVLRYLTYQLLGGPFILFTGWMLAGLEASPGDLEFVLRAGALLGFGFAFLLAIIPFHTWIPMLADEAPPYVTGFLFLLQIGLIAMFGLGFLDRYVWLRNSETLYSLLRLAGLLMVVAGGLWAAFGQRLTRIFGFSVMVEIGMLLLAISLGNGRGVAVFFALLPPRALGLLVWSVALTFLRDKHGSMDMKALSGAGWDQPLIAVGLLAAHLSMAGFPFLAGFPPRLALWRELALYGPGVSLAALAGSVGLMVAWLRTARSLFTIRPEPSSQPPLIWRESVGLIMGIALLVSLGLLGSQVGDGTAALASAFQNLFP